MDKKFIQIFTGLERNFGFANVKNGYTDPETGKFKLKNGDYGWSSKPVTEQDYIDHLLGKRSIGIQACDDEGMARFGAIDIDPEYKNFSPQKYLEIIKENNIPVVPCSSKSGGLHIFVFTKELVKAEVIRNFLDTLLFTFKLEVSTEIFPKQTKLGTDENGKKLNGNFINLPYFNKNERCALNIDGTKFNFEEFIQLVEANKKTEVELHDFASAHVKNVLQGGHEEFFDGPPCLQILTKNKLDDGRDRFLYNYMVFAKKKYPDDWEKKVEKAARDYFEYSPEWDDKKVKDKIKSWKKETKGHTCTQEPIVSHCMKPQCLKRKYGIASDTQKAFPMLSGLVKINCRPDPEYTFNVSTPGTTKVQTVFAKSIESLTDQRKMRNIIANAAGFVPEMVKANVYQDVLNLLFATRSVVEPAKGTSSEEKLFDYVKEYINGPKAENNISFRSGATLIEKGNAYFSFPLFMNVLKSKEWKFKEDKTSVMIQDIDGFIKGEIMRKRFPKKKDEKKSYESIHVVKVDLNKFLEKDLEEEILDIKGTGEII